MEHQEEVVPTYSIFRFLGMELPEVYRNFVKVKWMRSFRYGNDYMKLCDSDAYYSAYSHGIDLLLLKPKTFIRLAVLTDEPETALGFSVMRGSTLDYVYVHKDHRRQGITKFLLPETVETITHLTKVGLRLWPVKLPNAKFDPFS